MILALLSGFLAAIASLVGKLSMASDDARYVCELAVENWLDKSQIEAHYFCTSILTAVRAAFFLLMIICNAIMWTVFTKALRLSSATLEVTVVNLAANFFCSAIFGQTFFSEKLSILWYIGSVFIILGLCLMHYGNRVSEKRSLTVKEHVEERKKCDKTYPGSSRIEERHKARKAE